MNDDPMDWRRKLILFDGLAALTAGLIVLPLSRWFSEWYGLPFQFIVSMGLVNFAYACYSLSLAVSKVRPMILVILLAVANAAWSIACFGFAGFFWHTAGALGIAHLLGEGVFVGTLASLEWRWRRFLVLP